MTVNLLTLVKLKKGAKDVISKAIYTALLTLASSLFVPAIGQEVCPNGWNAYRSAQRADAYYQGIYESQRTCRNFASWLNSLKHTINRGRQLDVCLNSWGANLPPDTDLVNSYNQLVSRYRSICR